MNLVELIYQEACRLPESEAREVLDFMGYLKKRKAIHPPVSSTVPNMETDQRKAELLECFSRFHIDMTGFRFDREDANARR